MFLLWVPLLLALCPAASLACQDTEEPCGDFNTGLDCRGTIAKYLRLQDKDMVAAAREEARRIVGGNSNSEEREEENVEEEEEEWGPILGANNEDVASRSCLEKYVSSENPNITLTCLEVRSASACVKFLSPDYRDVIAWNLFNKVPVDRYDARGCYYAERKTAGIMVCAFTGLGENDDVTPTDDDVTPTDDDVTPTDDDVTHYATTEEVTHYATTVESTTYYVTTTEAEVATTLPPTTAPDHPVCNRSISRHMGEQDPDMVRAALQEGTTLIPNRRASCWRSYTRRDVTTDRDVTFVCKFLYNSRNAGSADYDICETFLDPARKDEVSWSLYDRVDVAGMAGKGCSYVLGQPRNVVVCAFTA